MKTLFFLLTTFITLPNVFASNCDEVVSQELSKFGYGTYFKPNGLDRIPGQNAHNAFVEFRKSDGFSIVAHQSPSSEKITEYFVGGSRYAAGQNKKGQFLTHVFLDDQCNVTKIEQGWRFQDAKNKVEVKIDNVISARFCSELYPQAVIDNPNLFCQKDKLQKFITDRQSSVATLDSHGIATVVKTCSEYPFKNTRIKNYGTSYESGQVNGTVPAK